MDEFDDPLISPLIEGAQAARNLFLAYVQVGFTEAQALHLTVEIVTAGLKAQQP